MSKVPSNPLIAQPFTMISCREPEVIDIRYNVDSLLVFVKDHEVGSIFAVEFAEVEGFRVLDEGDLLEFWPTCSSSWIYQIENGGWLDQECERVGFLARETKNVFEFFITGCNSCVNVITWSAPTISEQNP